MEKRTELYRGKAKTLYYTDNPELLVLEFRDDTSMGNGEKISQFARKGILNNKFNYFIMNKLQQTGISTHINSLISDNTSLVQKLEMIPIEFVIRNYAAGSLLKRLNIQEGLSLNPPIFEFFLKNDKEHDPMINSSYCETFGWISKQNLIQIHKLCNKINIILSKIFDEANLMLVDFKLEFGLFKDYLVLGDEFSPDVARLWDKATMKKMDKDLFRHNMDGLIESYEEISCRLGLKIN
ncbi:phosphoribosylaminoimidazolesuccinocarboxamide synthase [Pantoea sp. Mhis]|uniref:phosphoribosylaminoimidazolesuccinocarboxamide synthase n=1 Tax=Pantoea sp. Mhis TaxID=2576759 RepID=UPI00135B6A9F|nr:phosphoribosylaminoimidazolesuccinocarboxamide synthase [Pantoea sp. Mhis]MXP56586.1 phosphoribosylaminoimidazolesuccinocarboxamide synthase [Pantoea sp. Mhis]